MLSVWEMAFPGKHLGVCKCLGTVERLWCRMKGSVRCYNIGLRCEESALAVVCSGLGVVVEEGRLSHCFLLKIPKSASFMLDWLIE